MKCLVLSFLLLTVLISNRYFSQFQESEAISSDQLSQQVTKHHISKMRFNSTQRQILPKPGFQNNYQFDSVQVVKRNGLIDRYSFVYNNFKFDTIYAEKSDGDSLIFLRTIYTYGLNPNYQYIIEEWNGIKWDPKNKFTFYYDENKNEEISRYYEWNESQWDSTYRISEEYDAQGKILIQLKEDWVNSYWRSYEKHVYEYDENENLTYDHVYYNAGANILDIYFTWCYLYDEHNILEQAYRLDAYIGIRRRDFYSYDEMGNLIETIIFDVDEDTEELLRYKRILNNYNDFGKLDSSLTEIWSDSIWVKNLFSYYEYMNGKSLTYIECNRWNDGDWHPERIRHDFEDQFGNHYSFGGTNIYFYYFPPTDVRSNNVYTNYYLSQNYPNPFNPSTTIRYTIPVNVKSEKPAPTLTGSIVNSEKRNGKTKNNVGTAHELSINTRNVELKIYDILGREVATLVNKKQGPGNYQVIFDGGGLPSGIYIYRYSVADPDFENKYAFVESKKMILLK